MNIDGNLISGLTGALIGALGAGFGSFYSARAAYRGMRAANAAQSSFKKAEFRQAWINSLRDCMAEFHSYGTTPGIEAAGEREVYRLGTKIELLMNKNDPDYQRLYDAMNHYLNAKSIEEKYAMDDAYVDICQTILKREWEVLKAEISKE